MASPWPPPRPEGGTPVAEAFKRADDAGVQEADRGDHAYGDDRKLLALGRMSKSWGYQRIARGEIPSVRLGDNIKIERQDLQECLKAQHHSEPVDA